jgi:hypothetical protein
MTNKEMKRHHNAAYRACYVKPILLIHIQRLWKKWGWYIVDINAKHNGRLWCVDKNEGYDDLQSLVVDAEEALVKAERQAEIDYPA